MIKRLKRNAKLRAKVVRQRDRLYCPGCIGEPKLVYRRFGRGWGCALHHGAGTLLTRAQHRRRLKRLRA